jgi:hypothetical protein
MNELRVGRNELCPCGSGKKFKKCCLTRDHNSSSGPLPMNRRPFAQTFNAVYRQEPDQFAAAISADEDDSDEVGLPPPPLPSAVPVLPVEVAVAYTYQEPFGTAEVTYIFPAGQTFILKNDQSIENDYLKPGMQILLKDGALATITDVRLSYEPPDPPVHQLDGRVVSRVVGTIKHRGFSTVDVSWPGYTATSSPDHPYYSFSRRSYVPAQDLRVGEFLVNDKNQVVPVEAVSKSKFGLTELYNLEVEYFHNYFVGEPGGSAVLVHNGVNPTACINLPAVRQTLAQRLPKTNGSWVEGTPGNGVWRSTDIRVRQAAAAPGGPIPEYVDVPFQNNSPVFDKFVQDVHGIRGETKITLDTDATASLRTRTDRDFSAANRWLAEQLNNAKVPAPGGGEWTVGKVQNYLSDNGWQWHHHEDMTTMQLMPQVVNDKIAHIGGRSLKDFSFTPPLPKRKPK